jgi:hypothetical protein
MEDLKFNTDISSYTLDELLSLLDIKITDTSDVVSIKKLITDRSDDYILQFTAANREGIADFFRSVKTELLGNTVDGVFTNAQKLLLKYDKSYNPFAKVKPASSTGDSLYDSNNGSGNPINRKTVTKLLNIDSRFRYNYESTTSTDYLIDLPYQINNVIEIKLCDLELPSTYHPVSTSLHNNYFWIATYTDEQIITKTPDIYYIFIKGGNYYFDNLITLVNETFKKIRTDDDDPGSYNVLPISMSFDLNYNNLGGVGNGTGKVSIGMFSSLDISYNLNNYDPMITRVDLNFEGSEITGQTYSKLVQDSKTKALYYEKSNIPKEQRMGWMFGFREGYYGMATYYVSESVLNLLGPQYLFLIVDDFNKSNNVNFISTSRYGLLPDNIIARISLKGAAFSIQSQNDFSVYAEPRYYFGPVNINKLHVRVVDEFARPLDLNNSDFSFTLRMTTVYSAT